MNERYFVLHRGLFDKLKKATAARFVLAYIECFSRKDGTTADSSAEYMAERLRIGVASVKRSVKVLEQLGLITTERHKADKRGNEWGRPRNRYKVVKSAIDASAANWKKAHKIPEVVTVAQSMLSMFGATKKCILAATMDAVQKAADKLNKQDAKFGTISYSQADLAIMCGCDERSIRDILKEFESTGFVEQIETNLKWDKSRKSYTFHIPVTGKNDTKVTGKNDTKIDGFQQQKEPETAKKGEKSAKKTDTGKNDTKVPEKMIQKSPEKMIPNELLRNNSFMNESMSEDFSVKNQPACDVENSCFDDSGNQRMMPKLTDEEKRIEVGNRNRQILAFWKSQEESATKGE